MRVTTPAPSKASSRAPTSIEVTSRTEPARQMATLVVPPPTSMFITTPPLRPDSATAPEPCAAMVASMPSPALTATNLPASAANSPPIARALLRSTATPVRMSAPVSISSRVSPASRYWRAMKVPSAPASMVAPSSTYGVSRISDSRSTVRFTMT